MRRALPFLLLLLLPWAVHVRPAEARGGAAVVESLERRITQRLRTAGVDTSRCGLVVIERGPGRRVAYTLNPATPLVPASAAKVLTAAAALDLLGPSHVFRTRLTARGNLTDDGVLQGDLVLHGAGDPSISGRFFDGDAYAVPRRLARAAAEAGVRRVTGALVLDHGGFDRDYVHADWTAADKRRWYGAGVAGLAFNDGCIDVEVEGGARAGAATVRLAAGRGPWRMENGIRTEPGSRAAVGGRWVGDGPVLDLHGRVPVGGRASFNVPVPDPALFLGGAVLSALAAQNVLVDDGVRHARDADDARAGTLLGEHAAPLEPALQVMNQRSQNAYASTLFKTAGRALTGEGSWASGGRAVNAMLERRRIYDEGSTDMRDGSGLSTSNRVSAAVLAQVLHSFDTDPLRGPLLFRSLPISGESGTLDDRLRGLKGRVHAKTGTLNDVQARALAGYIERPGKPGYAFAILLNGRGASHGLIDDLVVEIAR